MTENIKKIEEIYTRQNEASLIGNLDNLNAHF